MQRKLVAMSIAALGVGFSSVAFSQQSNPPPARDTLNMPYQSGFWGHAGLSVGRAKLHADCPAGARVEHVNAVQRRTWASGLKAE